MFWKPAFTEGLPCLQDPPPSPSVRPSQVLPPPEALPPHGLPGGSQEAATSCFLFITLFLPPAYIYNALPPSRPSHLALSKRSIDAWIKPPKSLESNSNAWPAVPAFPGDQPLKLLWGKGRRGAAGVRGGLRGGSSVISSPSGAQPSPLIQREALLQGAGSIKWARRKGEDGESGKVGSRWGKKETIFRKIKKPLVSLIRGLQIFCGFLVAFLIKSFNRGKPQRRA